MSKPKPVAQVYRTIHGATVVIEIFRNRPRGFYGRWSCPDPNCKGSSGAVGHDIDAAIGFNEMSAATRIGLRLDELGRDCERD